MNKQMSKRIKKTEPPVLPSSHLSALADAGFTVISYLNEFAVVDSGDGVTRNEWLPQLCISGSGPYRVIQWLPLGHPSNGYSFSGWKTSSGRSSGGMYETISQALGWFKWVDEHK